MRRKRQSTPRRRQIVPLPAQPPAANPRLQAAILEVVDTQLRENTPPETRSTFERLVEAGYTPEGARQLIAYVVVREIFAVMSRGETYNATRFIDGLHRLPTLPDED